PWKLKLPDASLCLFICGTAVLVVAAEGPGSGRPSNNASRRLAFTAIASSGYPNGAEAIKASISSRAISSGSENHSAGFQLLPAPLQYDSGHAANHRLRSFFVAGSF